MRERLQKLLSQRGIASRRQSEKLILDGRVSVNGQVAELGQRADVDRDCVCVDGLELGKSPSYLYLLLHKPRGVVSTCHDPRGRKTVLDMLDAELQSGKGIHPVGRLDADSTGALLLTNDGELTYQLTHPSHALPKVYRVWVKGIPSEQVLQQWRDGVVLEGRKTLPAEVTLIRSANQSWDQGKRPAKRQVEPQPKQQQGLKSQGLKQQGLKPQGLKPQSLKQPQSLLEVTLTEGRNRQIRRIAEGLGHPVTALHRAKIGSLALGSLSRGRYRLLKDAEIAQLKRNT